MRVFTASREQPFGFVSYFDYLDFKAAAPETIAECLIPVAAGDPPRTKMALAVTPDYFQVLGVSARFGRTFSRDDRMAAVLAHGGADDLEKTLRISGKLYTIIGIAPESFGLDRFLHPDFYIPIRSYGDGKILQDRSRRFLTVHTRGRDNEAKLAAVAARLEQQHPDTNRGRRAVLLDELTARFQTDKMMTPLAALLGSLAALILTIACANACGALLMRAEARANVTSLKIALGASPLRLFCESLRESGGVALTGCSLAIPLAWAVTEALQSSIALPTDLGISISARIDGRIVALALASAFLATAICNAAPRFSFRFIAAFEIALATGLVATGGYLWAGLNAAKNVNLGYRTDHISVMTFDPGQAGYNESRTRGFYRELTERVQSLPGVRGMALAQSVPLGMTAAQKQIRIGGREPMTVWMNIVTPEYFGLMHIGLLQGRLFEDRQEASAIVNEELAKRIGVGETMLVGGKTVTIVGVVKTAKYMRWDEAPRPYFYLPYASNYASRMTLHVASDGPVFAAVRNLVRDVPMSDARALRDYFDDGAMLGLKIALRVAGFGGMGSLLLALAGLYSAVSNSVARRRREIGIRMALGEQFGSLLLTITGRAMKVAGLGIAAGLVTAEFGARLLRGFVPGSGHASLWAAALVTATSFIACAIPALRALRVDPGIALRASRPTHVSLVLTNSLRKTRLAHSVETGRQIDCGTIDL
jgi:ABC-type antimicrobial peptide transport system permease subunit